MISGTCRSYESKRYKCAEKGRDPPPTVLLLLDPVLINNRLKTDSTNQIKKRSTKNMKIDAKGIPKWSQIDAKSHQKSIPKLVSKKIMKIIKIHVSLNGKIIEIHCENNSF